MKKRRSDEATQRRRENNRKAAFGKWIGALLGVAVVLGAAGCANRHEKSVSAANERWLSMRSAQMLALSTQQFEVGDLKQAEKTVSEALAFDPENAHLHLLAGRILLEHGKLERSYHMLDRAIELDPQLARAHYYQGLVSQRWQQYDDALSRYERAYELEADNVAYLLAVGEMLVALDRSDEALARFEEKTIYFEQNAGLREAIGQLYSMRGEHERAVDYFRQAALLRPDDLQLTEELALAQLTAGQVKEAVPLLERLCADVDHGDRAYLHRALITAYRLSGRIEDARSTCAVMTRKDPSDVEAWQLMAELAWGQEDLSAALTAAGRVCKLAPQRPQGWVMAGLVWQKRGRTDRALGHFKRGANADKTNAEAAILHGLALEDLGRPEAAAKSYRVALTRDPQDARARQLLARVERPGPAVP